jgi:site-specific DNA recombinase
MQRESAVRREQPARRAAVYTRISKDADGDELGVKRQEKLCRQLAERNGWPVVGVFTDDNLTAFKRKRRPRFDALVEAIETGEVNAVAVYNPDRLSRDDLRGLEDLIDLLNAYDVAVDTVRAGVFDLSTAHGRAQARTAGVWARLSSELASERLRDKMSELVEQGKPNGGPCPYGYRRVGAKGSGFDTRALEVVPAEAAVVVEVIERVAAGQTLTRIAEDLNARGVPTARGSRWTLTNTRRMALNGAYAGRRFHKGVEVGAAEWPAIVDEGTWRRAAATLTDPSRAKRRSARRYLLSGKLLTCGKCGQPLRSKPMHGRSGPVPVYACRPSTQGGCGGVTVRAEAVEQLVAAAVIDYVEAPTFARAMHRRGKADPKAAVNAKTIERRLAIYERMAIKGELDPLEWKRLRDGLRGELADAQARMATDTSVAAVGRYAGQVGTLAEAWGTMSLDRRQAVVRAVVERIVVAPVGRGGRSFDPNRVTIEWRS